jgi:hypothetical protein
LALDIHRMSRLVKASKLPGSILWKEKKVHVKKFRTDRNVEKSSNKSISIP